MAYRVCRHPNSPLAPTVPDTDHTAMHLTSVAPTIDPDVIARLKSALEDARATLKPLAIELSPMEGRRLVEAVTEIVDRSVRSVVDAARQALDPVLVEAADAVRLIALGSYGRRELCPHSDIDLLFLLSRDHDRSAQEAFINVVLYGLWDVGFDIGHSVRTIEECVEDAIGEQSILSSLLDARLVNGDPDDPTFRELQQQIDRLLFRGTSAAGLIGAKLEESTERESRFGDSIYLLEPNVKESRGGLRELHTARWIARARWRARSLDELRRMGVISGRESRSIERAYEFLLRVRSELHLAAGRRQDNLQFRFQEMLATSLGYRRPDADPHDHLGTERFMRAYYFHAQTLRHYTGLVLERATHHRGRRAPTSRPAPGGFRLWDGMLTVTHRDQFKNDPSALVRLFRIAEEESFDVYSYTKDLAASNKRHIDRFARRSPKVVGEFLSLLESPHGDGSVLHNLHRLGLLQRLIPEWSRVTARWQQSLYHVYTVDVHSLEVVRNVKRLRNGDLADEYPGLSRLLTELPRPAVLYMAALLHDIGKGWHKGDHSERGAKVAQVVGGRFEEAGLDRWTARETADLVWLVRDHLTMSDIAQRRDVSDRHLVQGFAGEVQSIERLTMLYLLTFADMRGTSPKVWTDWKGALLRELYEHTWMILSAAQSDGTPALDERRRRAAEELMEAAASTDRRVDPRLIDAFTSAMPLRYLLNFSARQMVRHVQMWRDVSHGGGLAVHVRQLRREATTRLTVMCRDHPGLLAEVSGVLAAHSIDILSASIYSLDPYEATSAPIGAAPDVPYQHLGTGSERPDRIALDVLYVKDQSGRIADDPEKWDRIRQSLDQVVLKRDEVVSVLRARRQAGLSPQPRPTVRTKVMISNRDSRTETVIDVFGPDHMGALHTVAHALAELGLTISLAKISTQGDRLADGFYVTDANTGAKLEDPARIHEVKRVLSEALMSAAA